MSLRHEVSALPRTAWVLFAGTLINRFGSFVLFFLILYLRDRGFSAAQSGVVLAAYGVGGMVASLVGGYLADRVGRRNTIVLSMFLSAATLLALAHAEALWVLFVLTAATGATGELYRPAAAALLTDITVPAQRVTAFAVYRLAINLGVAVGPAVGGLLADHSFYMIFVIDAITSGIFGCVALLALPNTTGEAHAGPRRPSFSVIRRDSGFLAFLLASLCGGVVFMQFHAALPLQIKAYGFSNAVYGALMSLNGVLVMALELPLTTLTRRRSARAVMALGLVLIGLGFGGTGLMASIPFLAVTVMIWTLGEIVFVPVASAHVANIAPADMRGRYQGAWAFAWGLSHVIAPIAGTAAFDAAPGILWPACTVCALVGAVILGGWVRNAPPHATAAKAS